MDRWTTETRNFRTFLLVSQLDPGSIRARLKQARKEAGLTQQELADLIDRHKRTVENYENVRVPEWAELAKIARVLNRPVEWFLHGDAAEPTRLEDLLDQLSEVKDMLRRVDAASLALDRKMDTDIIPRLDRLAEERRARIRDEV